MSILTARRRVAAWVLLLLAAFGAEPMALAAPPAGAAPSTGVHTVFVTSNGWHSSIVIGHGGLPGGLVPEAADFPDARFVEFGWGDAEYYPAKDPGIGMALAAALAPTPSVVHMAGYALAPARRYPTAEVLALELDGAGFGRLVAFIDAAFDRGGQGRVASSGPGLYSDSLFYPALGEFHLFNTCNTWSARALAAAGLALDVKGTHSVEELMEQLRPLAKGREGVTRSPDIQP
ncbi:MAG: DUF2459 domain-containing protein [Rhodospirillales bacterium]|jgi:uncharacterized protein (TIGR02117 family)|nr:DUF2459 domain-containing protein [Rhodospirillales bacterium]MDP6882734.1 DUF2459 domain-containing protein [Rhodospirillales bacterium]